MPPISAWCALRVRKKKLRRNRRKKMIQHIPGSNIEYRPGEINPLTFDYHLSARVTLKIDLVHQDETKPR
jgi:hypothetical protein